MLTSEIIKIINTIEDRFPVASWEMNGIKIWPLLRIRLNFDLYYLHQTTVHATSGNNFLAKFFLRTRKVVSYLRAVTVDFNKNQSVKTQYDAVFLSDGVSFTKVDGQWYEKFCEPLITIFKRNSFQNCLLTPVNSYLIPRKAPSKFIQPRLTTLSAVAALRARYCKPRDIVLPGYTEVMTYLAESGCGVNLPSQLALYRLVCQLETFSGYFISLLSKLKPAVSFVVSYYNTEGMAFNLACHRLKIPCIDIQHGVQGELHVAYGRWNNIPATGFELLPSHFWCWSDEDAAAINAWSKSVSMHHKPLVGGNLWLDLWKTGEPDFVKSYDNKISALKKTLPPCKHVLATLQFNLDDANTLSPLLTAIRDSDKNWFWWVRLHPCMLSRREYIRGILQQTGNLNFELDTATDLPLYALLRHMDVHVTHSSSTVIEAKDFGIPSVIFSHYGMEFFPDQIASGWALVADNENVLNCLDSQLTRLHLLVQNDTKTATPNKALLTVLEMLRQRRSDSK